MDLLIDWFWAIAGLLVLCKIVDFFFVPKPHLHKKVKTVKSTSSKKIKTVKSTVSKKYIKTPSVDLLQNCIDNNEKISFTYIDNYGAITERTVSPKRIFWGNSNREGGSEKIRTCWVEAYCYTRNDRRTFIKDKISNVTLANESSVTDQGNKRRYSLDGVSLKELHFDLQAGKVSKQDALTAVQLKLKRKNMRDLSRKRWTRERDRLVESILSNTNNNKVESKPNLLKEAYAKTKTRRRR